MFLEHIAAAARENGISRFVADVLPENRKMLHVFSDAGYVVAQGFEDGVARVSFDLEPTEDSLAVTYAREHRAEARSVQRLLQPRSVVVVGAGRDPGSRRPRGAAPPARRRVRRQRPRGEPAGRRGRPASRRTPR